MFLRLIRALDGILAGIAFLTLLTLFPTLTGKSIGSAHVFFTLGAAWVAWCANRLPIEFRGLPNWRRHVVYLRWASMAAFGLSPFVHWWLRAPEGFYLFINAVICIIAAIIVLFQLNFIVFELARLASHGGLEIEARMARHAALYVSLVCLLAVILVAAALGGRGVGLDTFLLMRSLPIPVLYVPLLPVVLTMTLVARIRQPLEEMFHAVAQDRS